MPFKKIFEQFNFPAQCKRYDLTLWQCPSFLFFLTGLITILTIISAYFIGRMYVRPEIVTLIVLGITAVLLIIGHFIVQGFEKLAQANRMKSEFINIASHQLRTPLTGIKWTINLIMRQKIKKFSTEQTEYIKDIEENNQRMIDLVNDLLNVSMIEQGKLILNSKKFSIKKLIQDIIKEYSFLAKASNIEFSLQTKSNTSIVLADQQKISIVLHNLIDNAIRYTQKGGTVKIALLKNGDSIRCEIQDKGVGIPKKDQNKIFKKFFRSQNIMRYQTEGTGLGLYIAQAIIKASKGKIGFQSEPEKGSTFWFKIPIK
ncbi:MAG: HAMP domain-containing sensor histidine kinase [bacterium]